MEKYCIFCGQVLINGVCADSECRANKKTLSPIPKTHGKKRPMSLRDRRRQMYEMEEEEYEEMEEELPQYIGRNKMIGIVPYDEYHSEEEETEETPFSEETRAPWKRASTKGEPGDNICKSRNAFAPDPGSEKIHTGEGNAQALGGLLRMPFFICDYYKEPGKVVAAAAKKRDAAMGVVLLAVSVILSALGTLLFGFMYLEDFFIRWIVCGFITPLMAFGMSLLYGSLYVCLSPAAVERRKSGTSGTLCFRELFSAVAVSSVFPNLLLLLSSILSPMDKSLGVFQFFALLITISWMICLIFSLLTVYGGGFSLNGLLLTVVFMFLAFLTMRTLWVWYLTGEFGFSLYIPLSIFFS